MVRQGDIYLKKIEKLPKGLRKLNHRVIAEGEATGHKHELTEGTLYAKEGNTDPVFVRIDQPAVLTHQEHKPLELETGVYEITREREYDYFKETVDNVID